MRYLFALILLLVAPIALADLVLKNPESGAQLRLLDTECSHGETFAALAPEWRPKFKNARILDVKGFIQFYGCWIEHDQETVVVVLSDGATIAFDRAKFSDPAL